MKSIALVTVMILAGCIAEVPTSTAEQDICRDDPDTCPGGHAFTALQEATIDYVNANYPTASPAPTPSDAWCSTVAGRDRCHISVSLPLFGILVQVTCTDWGPTHGGVVCESVTP